MSIPEPNPINKGINVPNKLISWLENLKVEYDTNNEIYEMIKLIKERDQFGFKKYGQHLMTQDGRNSIEDARQELGDLMQYIMKAKINNEDITEIKRLSKILYLLLDD